jgi:hypothetical protein
MKKLIILGLIIGVGILIYGNHQRNPPDNQPGSGLIGLPEARASIAQSTVAGSQPNSGVMDIDDVEWRGVVVVGPSQHVIGKIITKGVWWRVRLDRDPNRVYTLYPDDGRKSSNLDVGPYNVMEWSILPGQAVKKGQVVWSKSPTG